MERKRLALLRHAKSSWDDPSLDDHDRPLNGRGRRAAGQIGVYLRKQEVAPALVLCSSAQRTIQTLQLLDLAGPPEILIEDALYGASAVEMLDRLHAVGARISYVLLIGHNPGIHDLALGLAGADRRLTEFPTAALAELSAPLATWADLRLGAVTLDHVVTPKTID